VLKFNYLKLPFHHLNLSLHHKYYSLLQNGFVLVVHTVFFGESILRKIFKIVATTGQTLRLKCIIFDSRWAFAPDPDGGAYNEPPDPLAGFKGFSSKGREGK